MANQVIFWTIGLAKVIAACPDGLVYSGRIDTVEGTLKPESVYVYQVE